MNNYPRLAPRESHLPPAMPTAPTMDAAPQQGLLASLFPAARPEVTQAAPMAPQMAPQPPAQPAAQPRGLLGGSMSPERALAFSAIGQGLSQLGSGKSVDLSKSQQALQERKEKSAFAKAIETSGVLDRMSPQQRAVLASMPPQVAQQYLMQLAFPAPVDPMDALNQRKAELEIAAMENPTPDPGYRLMSPEEVAAIPQLDPLKAYQIDEANNKITSVGGGVNIDMSNNGAQTGAIPPGWALVEDDTVPSGFRMEPITGGPADTVVDDAAAASEKAIKEAAAESKKDLARGVVTNASKYAREAHSKRAVKTGPLSEFASMNSASENAEVQRQVDVLIANAKIETLDAMRAASSTGASGLGALNESEAKMLADRAGALDPASPYFLRDLRDFEETLFRTVYAQFWKEEWDLAYPDGWGDDDSPAPATTGGGAKTLTYNPETGLLE